MTDPKLITILVPCFNEARNLPSLYERLTRVFEAERAYRFEAIILDNASEDGTRECSLDLCSRDPRWKYMRYSRNFGYHNSLAGGFDHAAGDALIVVVGDLQDPPELIPTMLRGWEAGNDVVYGVLRRRHDYSVLKTIGARAAYWLIHKTTDVGIPPNATDLRLVSRRVIDAVKSLREPDRYLRGLVHWVGYRQVSFEYDRSPRVHGNSNWGLRASIAMGFHAILCFSFAPLRLFTWLGVAITLCTILLSMLYLALYLTKPPWITPPPPGLTLISLLVMFSLGFNSLFLGVIGEYVGRIYNQGKQRPLYIVDERVNL